MPGLLQSAFMRRFAASVFLALGLASTAGAVDVSNLADSGLGSLRDAIASTPDGGTINFVGGATSGTITLVTGEIAFAKSLTLVGPGAGSVTISAQGSRIFNQTDGTKTFIVSGLTLSGAAAAGQGGAISTTGLLSIDSVQFSANQASDGGGAIFVGRLVASDQATAIIKNSAFTGNSVNGISGAGGGAILVSGTPTLRASFTLVNSTVSANTANASIGMSGGGIEFSNADVTLVFSTVAFNRAGASGSDLHQGTVSNTSLTIKSSIVSNGLIDVAPVVASDHDVYQPGSATINSQGFNVVQTRSAAPGYQASDAPDGTNPLLSPAANNGGPTLTDALQSGSPALDFVPIAQCTDDVGAPLLHDQRGLAFSRQVGGNPCDAGAFEAQSPDLTIAKSHVGNFTQSQVGATYTITVTNIGLVPTSGVVTVVDTVPAGLSATGLSGTGWGCNPGTLTCTRNDVLATGASYPAITLTVSVASNAPASVTNIVTVSGGGELDTSNNTASDPTTIIAIPDLTITKSHAGPFAQGQAGATYTITVSNVGGGATAGQVSVVDALPVGLTATALAGTGWVCNAGTLTCTRSDVLAPGGSYPVITLTVNVANNAPASVTNTATVSGGSQINTANDTASDVTAITQIPDLTIAKAHAGNFVQGQVGATYTITVTNSGFGPTAGQVSVVDTLPASLTATALSGTGWVCNLGTLTCTRSDVLGAGASYPAITLTVNVANNAPASVTNSVTVSGGGEVNNANDTATDPTTINAGADLAITKTHSGSFSQGQVGAIYTLTVSNAGGTATSGAVTVVDTLPAGMNATDLSGTGWGCVVATLTCTRSDALAPGASYPAMTLTVNVANNAPVSLTNSVTVSGGGDVNPANNTATDVTTIGAGPDLIIAKTHGGNFAQGQVGATYTITVTNNGATTSSGAVTVTDTLPASLSATAISGTGWACTLATLACTRSDALTPAASYPAITLTVNVAANAPTSVSNVATVAGGGDVNPANNSATDATTITQTPDLTIAKSHVGSFTQGQVGATYTITVTNAGAGPTTAAVTVVDTLPASLTATAMSGTGWACVVGTLTCTRSDVLAAGASYPAITLTVNVSLTAPASVTNIATVSGGGENNAGNDSASDVTTVILTPDLTLAKTHAGVIVQGATGIPYSLVVTNKGAGPTVGTVTVVDTLPSALTATAMSGTGWTCTLATLTCTRADVLAAGASYPPITLTVDVATNAQGIVTNSATVGGGGDANPGNNSGSDSVNLAPPAPIDVPALSPWALFALAALLIMGGAMRARRRRQGA